MVTYALAKVIPDHDFPRDGVLIESKYLRASTTVAKVTDQLAADLVKYPSSAHVVFVLYDPERLIRDDAIFIRDVQADRNCRLLVLR